MSTTSKNVFSTVITDFYVNTVCSQLVAWLKTNKGVEVTPEELCQAFDVPYVPKTIMSGLPQAANTPVQMPGYMHGTGASPNRRKGGRKKKIVDPNAPKCQYTFQRGKRQDELCGDACEANPSILGSDRYCKTCLKKKTVIKELESGAGSSVNTVAPPAPPSGYAPIPQQNKPREFSLDVVEIEGQPGFYRDIRRGFIIQKLSDETIVAIAVEDDDGVQRPLTQEEKNELQPLGVSFPSSPAPLQTGSVPVVPQVPHVPQLPGVVAQIPATGGL